MDDMIKKESIDFFRKKLMSCEKQIELATKSNNARLLEDQNRVSRYYKAAVEALEMN